MDKNIKEEIEYEKAKEKLIKFLENKENSIMVLATSANNVVMARNINVANDKLDIYFFTWEHSRKCTQIRNNPRVALCKDKVEIEGKANVLGLMLSKENKKYTEIIRKRDPDAIKQWKNKPSMVIVKIQPIFTRIDGYYDNGDVFIEYIDLENKKAYKEKWSYY
ncbi:MAG: pyridoxamine 5'-phosphate oxidase family protein [bacterium]